MAATVRVCAKDGCENEAAPRKRQCYEHWLAKQPPAVRHAAAARRAALIPEAARLERVPKDKWPQGRRWCAGCQTFVLLELCSGSRCRDCSSAASHLSRIKSEFGIDAATYHWLLEKQGGKCAICRQRPLSTRLAVDHDHACCPKGQPTCGKCVRGLLCARCNHELLGAAHDSIHILRNAVAYLERPPFGGEWDIPAFERDEFERKYGTHDAAPF